MQNWMARDTITITLQGESCTVSMDPLDAYLRIKIYVPGVKPCPLVLQGISDEPSPYAKRATVTFPLPAIGQEVRIDAYSGDGEGTLLNRTYKREENGLTLKGSQINAVEVRIEQG